MPLIFRTIVASVYFPQERLEPGTAVLSKSSENTNSGGQGTEDVTVLRCSHRSYAVLHMVGQRSTLFLGRELLCIRVVPPWQNLCIHFITVCLLMSKLSAMVIFELCFIRLISLSIFDYQFGNFIIIYRVLFEFYHYVDYILVYPIVNLPFGRFTNMSMIK